jgi:hypothetical protein
MEPGLINYGEKLGLRKLETIELTYPIPLYQQEYNKSKIINKNTTNQKFPF